MYNKIISLIVALVLYSSAFSQTRIIDVLNSIEANNITLKAAAQRAEANSLEARTGNSPDDLSVSYNHLWGDPASFGKTGELEITQTFDFPTVYVYRNRVAKNLASQYDYEYLALRQETLVEAKELCIELHNMLQQRETMNYRIESNEYLRRLYNERYERGDATLLEKSKIDHEYLLLQKSSSECDLRISEIINRLTLLNGGEKLEITAFSDEFEELKPLQEVEDYYQVYAPSLMLYNVREQGAEDDVKLSRSAAIPKVELGYKHEYGTADRERFNGVVVGLSVPIFSNRYNVKRAQAAQTAAKFETQDALNEFRINLSEMYQKAGILKNALINYDNLPGMEEYYSLLIKALNAGEISIIEYFSEVYSYYDVLEAKRRMEMEYRMITAKINMVYL